MHFNERKHYRRRRFRIRKNNEAYKTSDPIQSNPIQSNPIHGWIQSMSNSGLSRTVSKISCITVGATLCLITLKNAVFFRYWLFIHSFIHSLTHSLTHSFIFFIMTFCQNTMVRNGWMIFNKSFSMNFIFTNNSDFINDVKTTSRNKSKIKQINKKRFETFYKQAL